MSWFASLRGTLSRPDYVAAGIVELLRNPDTIDAIATETNDYLNANARGDADNIRDSLYNLREMANTQMEQGPAGLAALAAGPSASAIAAANAAKVQRTQVKRAATAAALAARPVHMIGTFDEVYDKYTRAGGKFEALTSIELVRLFSPRQTPFDYDVRTQEGYNDWVRNLLEAPKKAYNDMLNNLVPGRVAGTAGNAQQEAQAQQAATSMMNSIMEDTIGHLQTAIPTISFFMKNTAGGPQLSYGVCGATLSYTAGDSCERIPGFYDAENFQALKNYFTVTRKWNESGNTQYSSGWQSFLNVMTLEDIKPFIKPGWVIHDEGHAFNTPNLDKNFVVYKWLNTAVGKATQSEIPIDIGSKNNFILGDKSFKIFLRWPDMALIYVNQAETAGQINPPLPSGLFINDSNRMRVLTRNLMFETNFNALIVNPIGGGSLPDMPSNPGADPLIDYRFPALTPANINLAAYQKKIKMAVTAMFYRYRLQNPARDVLNSFGYQGGGVSLHRRTKNKHMNKRQRRSKSKSKSMSMFKSAKRAFYKTNKRNKTSRKN